MLRLIALVIAFALVPFAAHAAQDDVPLVEVVLRVENEDGIGLAGALVMITDPPPPDVDGAKRRWAPLTTDVSGYVTLQVPPRTTYTLLAVHHPSDSERAEFTSSSPLAGTTGDATVQLRTQPDRHVPCRFVDPVTGRPIQGVQARIAQPETSRVQAADAPFQGTSGADGRVTLNARSWRNQAFEFIAPGRARGAMFLGGTEWPDGEVELRMHAAEPRQLVLLGRPENTEVQVQIALRSMLPAAQLLASRESNGYYTADLPVTIERDGDRETCLVDHAPPGAALIVRVDRNDPKRSVLRTLLTPEHGPLPTFDLAATGTVEGILQTLDERPLEGAHVWIRKARVDDRMKFDLALTMPNDRIDTQTADDVGAFRFDGLMSGRYVIGASLDRGRAARLTLCEVNAHAAATDITINVVETLRVSGRLLDRHGAPVHGRVSAAGAGEITSQSVETDPETGSWSIGPLPPGLHMLVANSRPSRGRSDSEQVLFVEAGRSDIDIALQDRGNATATIEDEDGRPVRAQVYLIDAATKVVTHLHTRHRTKIRTRRVPQGEHLVFAVTADGRMSDVAALSIAPPRSRGFAKLTVRQAATLRVTCAVEDLPVTLDVRSDQGHHFVRVITDASPTSITIPTGTVTIERTNADEPVTTERLQVAPGDALER